MKEFDEIEELFGNAFGDFEVSPPSDVKVAIDKQITYSQKQRGYWYYGWSIVTMIVFLAVNIAAKIEPSVIDINGNGNASSLTEQQVNNELELQEKVTQGKVDTNLKNDQSILQAKEALTVAQVHSSRRVAKKSDLKENDYKRKRADVNREDRNATATNWTSNDKNSVRQTDNKNASSNSLGSAMSFAKENEFTQSSTNRDYDLKKGRIEENKTDETLVKLDSTEVNTEMIVKTIPKEKNDSLQDQIGTNTDEPNNGLPTNTIKNSMNNWLLFSVGPDFALNGGAGNNSELEVKSRIPILNASLEYNFGINERIGLSTGFSFNQFKEQITYNKTVQDSVFAGFVTDTVWNPNTQQYDSVTVASYQYFSDQQIDGNTFRFTSFELPVYATWMINKESKYDISISAGIKVSYNTFRALDGNQLTELVNVNPIGLKLLLRPQFVYYFGKFGCGAYVKYSSEILPVVQYMNTKRLRQEFGVGLMVRYNF